MYKLFSSQASRPFNIMFGVFRVKVDEFIHKILTDDRYALSRARASFDWLFDEVAIGILSKCPSTEAVINIATKIQILNPKCLHNVRIIIFREVHLSNCVDPPQICIIVLPRTMTGDQHTRKMVGVAAKYSGKRNGPHGRLRGEGKGEKC